MYGFCKTIIKTFYSSEVEKWKLSKRFYVNLNAYCIEKLISVFSGTYWKKNDIYIYIYDMFCDMRA